MDMNEKFEAAIDGITNQGYAIIDNFINNQLLKALNKEMECRKLEGLFNKASIGNSNKIVDEGQRGDFISWLQDDVGGAAYSYLSIIEEFRNYFNQTCYLGLASSEIHFACYPEGSFYKTHLDAFKNTNKRKISIITYLNQEWAEEYGGQLMVYHDQKSIPVLPIGGRMICFESEKIPHEVLASTKERRSVSGWFLST